MPSKKEFDDMQKLLDSFDEGPPEDSNTTANKKAIDLMDAMTLAEELAAKKEKLRKAITGK